MWRQLLARLHPDAGGDPELFLFACSIKDQVCKPERPRIRAAHRGAGADSFLRAWQDTISTWATSNRDTLNVSRDSSPRNRGGPL